MASSGKFGLPWPLALYLAAAVAMLAVTAAIVIEATTSAPGFPASHQPMAHPAVRVKTIAPKPKPKVPSVFEQEEAMSYGQLMRRWNPLIEDASKKFGVPQSWIRAVMRLESGGRTMLSEHEPMVSSQGAMGLMQLMPETYREMSVQYGLGGDPFDPHDNIYAGAAYLRFLRQKYGYPTMFAAYNDGPGNLEARLRGGNMLPDETQLYIANITVALSGMRGGPGNRVKLTRPDGTAVLVDAAVVSGVRPALPDEYAPGVLTVITVGRMRQGVREGPALTKALIRTHGGGI